MLTNSKKFGMSEIEEKDIIDDYVWNQQVHHNLPEYFENSELVIPNNFDVDTINKSASSNNKFYEYLDPVTSFVTMTARFPYSLFSATSMLLYDNLFKKYISNNTSI